MKLHLPKQLFTALLTAITLAAAPAALTLGSAAWGTAASYAEKTITYDEQEIHAAVISGTDNKNMELLSTLTEGYILTFSMSNGASGTNAGNNYFNLYGFSGENAYTGDIFIYDDAETAEVEGLIINNGSGTTKCDFTGRVFGNGDIHKSSSAPSSGTWYTFKGDMSDFVGDIKFTGGNANDKLIFIGNTVGSDEITNASGSIEVAGATMLNTSITAKDFKVKVDGDHQITTVGKVEGNGESAVSTNLTATNLTIDSGATLNLVNGNLTIGSAITNSGTLNLNAEMTVNEGTTVSMTSSGSGITNIGGSITNNGTLKLISSNLNSSTSFIFATENGQITNTGTIDMSGLFKGNNNGDHDWNNTTKQFTSLINAISGGEVILTGAADAYSSLTLQLGGGGNADPATVTFAADYKAYGNLTLANYNEQTLWKVTGALSVYGESRSDNATRGLAITNLQKLLIVDGARVQTTGIRLGHFDASAAGGHLEMTGGELTTGNIIMRSNSAHSTISITGGSVEFTDATAVTCGQGAPTIAIGGTGEKSVTLKATQTNWTLGATNLATSIGNITIDAANTHSITLQHASFNGTITNNTANGSLLILGEGAKVKAGESLTLNGNATFSHTITNDGSLTLNGAIYLAGDIDSTYEHREQGGTSYALAGSDVSNDLQNGFMTVEGASYYLTQSSNGVTSAENTLGSNFATNTAGDKVVYHGTASYEVDTDSKGLYFSTGDITGTLYYITTGGVVVNNAVQNAATGYILQGGNMQLTEGSMNTSTITYTSGSITLSDGAELVLDAMPAGMTVNSLLSGILSVARDEDESTQIGRLKITQETTLTSGFEAAYTGAVEINNARLIAGTGPSQSVKLASISNFILNDGGELYYHANPTQAPATVDDVEIKYDIQKITVESGTGSFKLQDSDGASLEIGEISINENATFKFWSNWYDSDLNISALNGAGTFRVESSDDSAQSSKVDIDSLAGFTGSMEFVNDTARNLAVTIDTGTSAVNFKSLQTINTSGTAALTLNAQADTTIGLLSAARGTVNVSANKTLTLGGGTAEAQKLHSIGTLTVGDGGKLNLEAHSALTLENSQAITYLVSGAGELVVKNGVTLTFDVGSNPDNKKFDTNVRIQNGGRMEFTGTNAYDQLNYGNSHTVYLEGTAELALGDTRQTVGNWTFDMTGGTISGKGMSSNLYALDFHRTGSIVAHAATGATLGNPTVSTVSANIKNRDGGGSQLNLVVDKNARLNLTGDLRLEKPVKKSGAGLAVISGTVTSLGEVHVTGGTLELQSSVSTGSAISVSSGAKFEISAGTSALRGAVTNNGDVAVSGGSATLSGAVTNNGAITVSGGTADFTNTLSMGTGSSLSVSDGSATLSGAVTNSGAITVSGGTADSTNTLDMAQGSSLSVSGGAATLSGALNVTGSNVQIEQSGEGSLTLTGNISIAENAAATLSGTITLGHTITNDGSLTLNGTIYLSGDIDTSFARREQGSSTYVGINGEASTGNNGFQKITSASYWLTQSSDGETGSTITLGEDFATLEGKKVVYQGDSAFQLDTDTNEQLYFSTSSITGTQYYISSGDVEITSDVLSKATGYTLRGGNMQITTGEVNTSAITYTAGTIELSDGAQLKVDALLGNKTAADLLTGIVTATPATEGATPTGKLVIATNNLATGNAGLATTFSGTLELAEKISFTFGAGEAGSDADKKIINTSSLTGLVLNAGSTLKYTGNGVNTQFANTTVNGTGSAATFHIIDGDNANAIQFTGKTMLNNNLNLTSDWGAKINIAQLAGGGTLTASGSSSETFYTSIESLNGFTGSLIFADTSSHEVTISTGTGSDLLSFTKLQFASGQGVTNRFNVQKDTTVGTISVSGGGTTINIEESGTLHAFTKEGSGTITLTGSGVYDLGRGNTDAQVNGLGNANWTGTVKLSGISNANGLNFSNYGNVSSKVELDGVSGWFARVANDAVGYNTHVVLKGDGLTMTNYSSNESYKFNKGISGTGDFIINGTASAHPTIKIGANTGVNEGLVWSGAFKVNSIASGEYVNLELKDAGSYFDAATAASGVQMNSTETLNVYTGNASGGTTIINGTIANNGDGSLNLNVQGDTEFSKNVTATKLTVDAGKTAALTGTTNSLTVGNATITSKSEANAELSNVKVVKVEDSVENTISAKSTSNGANGSISNANVAIAQLAEDASFTIQDMTLTNTTITAASVNTRVNLNNVSGDATLAKGTFGLQMQAGTPNVGLGGASLGYGVAGTPSLTLGATDAKLVITADPSADVSGIYRDYTLTFNLNVNLDSVPVSGEDWKALVGFEGWLGTMLENQNATYQVADGAAQVSEGASTPAVSYGYTAGGGGGNVGTLVITISGLNVPEPTTSTLSLLALAALAARRRRK